MIGSFHFISSDEVSPAVKAFDAILVGSLAKFIADSDKIGGDVKTQVYIHIYLCDGC